MDSYIAINLPNIWSPIMQPKVVQGEDGNTFTTNWAPYEFKWIDNLGAQMIKKISITCGNQTLQEYTGQYILAMAQRDFNKQKLELFNVYSWPQKTFVSLGSSLSFFKDSNI